LESENEGKFFVALSELEVDIDFILMMEVK